MLQNAIVSTEVGKKGPSSISHPSQQQREKAPLDKIKWRYFCRQRLPEESILLVPFQPDLLKDLAQES